MILGERVRFVSTKRQLQVRPGRNPLVEALQGVCTHIYIVLHSNEMCILYHIGVKHPYIFSCLVLIWLVFSLSFAKGNWLRGSHSSLLVAFVIFRLVKYDRTSYLNIYKCL